MFIITKILKLSRFRWCNRFQKELPENEKKREKKTTMFILQSNQAHQEQ